ncbi:DUF790 family protein [Thermoplasma sp.]|uniref:DUF790 family protein n=1 Tax=Thermoplasma sp. TaxID=1973142 RepID=UPI001276EEBC|nr:DUF790 family protein [Thermoplasma sp.]KAA8923025.1 MAG: DUF790 family protein [Thermoplasma sp.]
MVVRKAQDGTLRPLMIAPDRTEIAERIIEVFRSSTGRTRREIAKEIVNIEYGIRNPKIVRGLALIMERLSKFRNRSKVNSREVRNFLFQMGPAVSPEERQEKIARAAEHFSVSSQDIEEALYGDMDSENVLEQCPAVSPEDLNRRYNLEELTTLMSRSRFLEISGIGNWYRFISLIKRQGLIFEAQGNPLRSVRIDGPNSVFNNMERYGSAIARSVEKLAAFSGWTLHAEVDLKGKLYSVDLDSSISYYLPTTAIDDQETFPDPVVIGTRVFFPTRVIEINGQQVYVDVVYHMSPEAIRKRDELIRSAGIRWITVVVGECKKFQGILCFRTRVDWDAVMARASQEYPVSVDPLKEEIDSLYPDTEAILDLLDRRRIPLSYLERIGYRIRWNGILPEVMRSQ